MGTETVRGMVTASRIHGLMLPLFIAAASLWLSSSVADETEPELSDEQQQTPPTHMSEALRSSVKKVVVLPGRSPVEQATTGSYEKQTAGLAGGVEAGSRIGDGVGTEVGPVSMRIPVPILTMPGALIGGIAGKTQREIQEFRDALTEDLAKAASQPLTNDALASDVFWGIRRLPSLDSKVLTPTAAIPEDTDAILYVGLSDITIDVQGNDAVITTSASATLQRKSDGEHLFEGEVTYQDRDELKNWTKNDKALWHEYANFARHYIGREISAQVFDRVELKNELRPTANATIKQVKKNEWHGVSRTLTPTLAWELNLLGGDVYGTWTNAIDEADIAYDVEIYDSRRLVYSAKGIRESRHTVEEALDACKNYRWSVRPSYRVGKDLRLGEWMRFSSDTYKSQANVGRQASEAPAYTQDFALLNIKCGSK